MRKKQNFKNIVIFGHSNIGDVCYDLVVIAPLRKVFPEARISYITAQKSVDLGRVIAGVDEVIVFDKHGRDKGLPGYAGFVSRLRQRRFDLLIALRDIQMHYFLGVPKTLKLKKKIVRATDRHVADKYLLLLREIGIVADTPRFDFNFSGDDLGYARNVFAAAIPGKPVLRVGIMPLAGWPLKCWSIEKWNALISLLIEKFNARVFVLGKTGGGEWEKEFVAKLSKPAVSLIDHCTVRQSMVLTRGMDLFIGPDSSFLHIASCLGIPTIGLYGATDTEFIYPLFHKQNIVVSPAQLECMPCYPGPHGGGCGIKDAHAPCMEAITPEMVFARVNSVIAGKNPSKK